MVQGPFYEQRPQHDGPLGITISSPRVHGAEESSGLSYEPELQVQSSGSEAVLRLESDATRRQRLARAGELRKDVQEIWGGELHLAAHRRGADDSLKLQEREATPLPDADLHQNRFLTRSRRSSRPTRGTIKVTSAARRRPVEAAVPTGETTPTRPSSTPSTRRAWWFW